MALATADAGGRPAVRMVILRGFDRRGLVFFTDSASRKARELAENPAAALLFYWTPLGRQVRVEGGVERVSSEESEAWFRRRSRNLQVAAWASPQSRPIPSREWLEEEFRRREREFRGREVPRPPGWGGYRLIPARFEFWARRENGLHDRFLYRRHETGWRVQRLAP